LVEETGVPGENHRPAASHWKTLGNQHVTVKRQIITYLNVCIE
jgi:hypothetical protein